MPNVILNYDGSITTTPQQLVYPKTVQELQSILRDSSTYPSPVRAKGSYHSLTPCVSSDGTIVDMSAMAQVIEIDAANKIFTAQAGLQFIDASKALREQGLQFMTNIEIGNMTLGASITFDSKTNHILTMSQERGPAPPPPPGGGRGPQGTPVPGSFTILMIGK